MHSPVIMSMTTHVTTIVSVIRISPSTGIPVGILANIFAPEMSNSIQKSHLLLFYSVSAASCKITITQNASGFYITVQNLRIAIRSFRYCGRLPLSSGADFAKRARCFFLQNRSPFPSGRKLQSDVPASDMSSRGFASDMPSGGLASDSSSEVSAVS